MIHSTRPPASSSHASLSAAPAAAQTDSTPEEGPADPADPRASAFPEDVGRTGATPLDASELPFLQELRMPVGGTAEETADLVVARLSSWLSAGVTARPWEEQPEGMSTAALSKDATDQLEPLYLQALFTPDFAGSGEDYARYWRNAWRSANSEVLRSHLETLGDAPYRANEEPFLLSLERAGTRASDEFEEGLVLSMQVRQRHNGADNTVGDTFGRDGAVTDLEVTLIPVDGAWYISAYDAYYAGL